jgi:glycerol-1-phosphate dehydrogenase [NAD(P)+]
MNAPSHDALARLLAGHFADPDGPGMLHVDTRLVAIEKNFAGQEGDLLRHAGIAATRFAVVSDTNTHPVMGARIEAALRALGTIVSVVLTAPHADGETVAQLRAATRDCEALIAVGSGTINDLCKYAAFQDGKPYAVFGTAPSMNGYTSPNAAITIDGHKKSLPAAAPVAVLLELQTLARAPIRLIRSGLGDSLCRCTAQADWMLAHLVRGEPYREAPFALLHDDETPLFAAAGPLVRGDLEAMNRLARTLVLSGFGMAICGSSQPASQGEHLVSHYIDMMGDPSWPQAFHGEQIAVTTLTLARLQEAMLAAPAPRLHASTPTRADLVAIFGAELGETCWSEFARKRLDYAHAQALNTQLGCAWPQIRAWIAAILRPARELEDTLRRAGAATTPAELGWPEDFYGQAVLHAREIRNRWTFLDLAADSGVLTDAVTIAAD